MAHNTKPILVDVNGKPIPQYFDPLADEYKPLLGQHGAARSILYGPDGNPISDTNKLPVRAADLETLIGALNDSAVTNPANAASVIAALKGLLSVVGKEATLGQILSALAPLATESTLSSLASAVAKETTLGGVKTAVDVLAGTVDTQAGAQKVTLSGSAVELARSEKDVVIGAGASLVVLGSGGPVELAGVKEIRGIVRGVSGAPLSSLTVKIDWSTGSRFAWGSNVSLVLHPTNSALSRLPVDSDDTKAHSRVLHNLTIVNNDEADDITVNYLFMGVC